MFQTPYNAIKLLSYYDRRTRVHRARVNVLICRYEIYLNVSRIKLLNVLFVCARRRSAILRITRCQHTNALNSPSFHAIHYAIPHFLAPLGNFLLLKRIDRNRLSLGRKPRIHADIDALLSNQPVHIPKHIHRCSVVFVLSCRDSYFIVRSFTRVFSFLILTGSSFLIYSPIQ